MNFNSVFEELNKLYENKPVEDIKSEDEKPIEENCEKESLKEAAEDEIEFAEEPVEVIPEDSEYTEAEGATEAEVDEEIPEEDVDTVKDFAKSLDEYDGKLKLEFKPIIIDGKEYPVTGIMWDDTEEGKLVAEVVFDMSVEEAAEETAEEEPVEESLKKDENLDELFNLNVGADLRNFGGTGNNVSVLSGGSTNEDLEKEAKAKEDEDLDELFNANIKLDARGFGGSGNDVGIL